MTFERNAPGDAPTFGGPRKWAIGMASTALAVALANLVLGWGLGITFFIRLDDGLPAMVPGTSAAFLLLAVAQLLVLRADGRQKPLALGLILAAGVVALAYTLLVNGPGDDRMSVATLAGVLLVVAAKAAARFEAGRRMGLHVVLAGVGAGSALFGFSIYMMDFHELDQIRLYTGLSTLTALELLLLSVAVMFAHPRGTWVATLFSPLPGGETARRTLPVAVLAPLVLCGIFYIGTTSGLVGISVILGVMAVGLSLLGTGIVIRTAARQNDLARQERIDLDRTRNVLSALDVSIIALDTDLRTVVVNRKAEELIGRDVLPDDWLNQAIFHALRDRRPLAEAMRPLPRLVAGPRMSLPAGWTITAASTFCGSPCSRAWRRGGAS